MTITGYTLFELSQRCSLPLYAIVDPMQYPALPDFWRAFQPRAAQMWQPLRFDGAGDDWQRWAPMVVQVDEGGPGETLLHWLADTQPARHQGVMLMHSEQSLTPVADFWQQRLRCGYPDGTLALLRSYVPAVLRLWWQTLNDDERMAFMGLLTGLYLPLAEDDPAAPCRYHVLADHHERQPVRQSTDDDYLITLNRDQFYLLSNDNRLHRLANELFLYAGTLHWMQLDIEVVKSRFLSGVTLARIRYPLASETECEAWSAHRWIIGSEFYHHPVFIHLTERYSLGDSIRIFKSESARVEDVRLHYHRPGWMRGELPDTTEVMP
ncbi:DUF4123 domain-containing protein [Dickeya fangzhongdai]|uniref:DUF4123 domain-containing protein n=1 Tax=Dickeya fangzhongdai TaxID=1778540 RepID=UPI0026E0FFE2|nr:DUF4123 domain-containing protein [Dickeya fangzhongdai]WKV51802.1 DUF4123 domain-containing protein [Dickeya fangzhongdai]